jgi:hypothetical protein
MSHLPIILGGLGGAVAGFVALATIVVVLSGSAGSADATVGRMMVAFFVIAPFGGLAGLVVGSWAVLRWRGVPSWPRAFAYSAVTLVIGTGIAGVIAYWAIDQADTIVRPNQATLELEFEIRMPTGATVPQPVAAAKIELRTDMNRMPGRLFGSMSRKDGERAVIGGRVEVYFRTSNRLLALMIPKEPERTFSIALPARPPVSATYSRWVAAHALDAKRGISENFDVRYRIVDPVVSKAPD